MTFNACAECGMLSVTVNCIMLSVIMMYVVMLNVLAQLTTLHFLNN
jgi:hypothetical protein